MTATKFTPGPWKVGYLKRDVGVAENTKIGGYMKLFDIRGWGYLTGGGYGGLGLPPKDASAIQEANANLIAAAPELYEGLQMMLDHYLELANSGDAGFWNPEEEEKIIKARSILAKARGETE